MPENSEKKPTDYSGLIVAAILVPAFFCSFTSAMKIWG